ncbi:MAG: phosphatidylglycerophosphatase A [Bdellovibrionales bacterium]|nr:phosphatidylglycerophosphatase A [Bdellovibrionales bacterium]
MQGTGFRIAYFLATLAGVGRLPRAPGTAGSLAALPLAWFLWKLPAAAAWALVVFAFFVGTAASEIVIRGKGTEDPQDIVIDEAVGIFLATATAAGNPWLFAAAFVVFRIFDIWKPFPISLADSRVKGGFGAMLDDAIAGGISLVVIYLVQAFSLASSAG